MPSEADDWLGCSQREKQTDLDSTFNMLKENKEVQIPRSLDKQHVARGEQVCVCKPERGPKARFQGCDEGRGQGLRQVTIVDYKIDTTVTQ